MKQFVFFLSITIMMVISLPPAQAQVRIVFRNDNGKHLEDSLMEIIKVYPVVQEQKMPVSSLPKITLEIEIPYTSIFLADSSGIYMMTMFYDSAYTPIMEKIVGGEFGVVFANNSDVSSKVNGNIFAHNPLQHRIVCYSKAKFDWGEEKEDVQFIAWKYRTLMGIELVP